MNLLQGLETIVGVVIALLLAIFAKRYSDMRKRDILSRLKEVEDVKATIIHRNDSTDLESLVDRENKSARRRHDT